MNKPCSECKHQTGSRVLCKNPKNPDFIWSTRRYKWPFDVIFKMCGERGRWWEKR